MRGAFKYFFIPLVMKSASHRCINRKEEKKTLSVKKLIKLISWIPDTTAAFGGMIGVSMHEGGELDLKLSGLFG